MKKLMSFLPFIIACCLLIGAIGCGVFGIYDINREVQWLEQQPGVSGVDYLNVHAGAVFYGTGVFLASACGMIFAGISRKVVKNEKLHTTSGILMVLLGLLLFLPVGVCILGML